MGNANEKKLAGEAALRYVEDGAVIGVGTGSTVAFFIDALAGMRDRIKGAVSSSEQSTAQLRKHGIEVFDLNATGPLSVYVDGADECDPFKRLIKGGGAALTREKIVAAASQKFVCIIDSSKRVDVLGRFPLPIEVVAFGHKTTALRICDALAECDIGAAPRLRMKDGEPVRTDGGNLIYDAACGRIPEPALLAEALKSVTGVVDHGLFLDLADQALIGAPDGVLSLEP